ncbi:MAG: hypothetical protein KatS3mg087_1509 [Patescibacteria group bacterium]|nr:MAG: hypothetical protein KatS3mg087_1509 [Patescibacteria group bacterium]
MLRLVLERTVGQYKLPDGVAIVAAANPPSEAAGGWELAPPLVNRFTHLFIKPDIEGFCRAMEAGHWEKPSLDDIVIAPEAHAQARLVWGKRVAQFLRLNPALVSTAGNDDNPAFATMRSWDYAVSLMASCEVIGAAPKPRGAISDEFANLVVGTIGEAAALPFFDWVRNMRLPSAKGVLEGREIVDPAILREDEINVVFGEMTRIVVDDGVDMKVGAVNYLDTAIRLVENEKADIVFVHVRELVEKGALPKLHKVAPDKVVELSDKLYSFGEQVERLATN